MLTNALLFFYVMFCHKVFTLDNIYLSTVFDMAVSAQCISQLRKCQLNFLKTVLLTQIAYVHLKFSYI